MEEMKQMLVSPKIWISILSILTALGVVAIIRRAAKEYFKATKLTGKRATNAQAALALIRYCIYIVALLVVLQVNGINVGSLAASLGLATAAVAFAVQDVLKDIIMGANIMTGEFFGVGDVVQYEDMIAVVQNFDIKTTKLFDISTGNVFTICNRNISEIQRLSDWLDVQIPIGYDRDVESARAVCREICGAVSELEQVRSCEFLGTDTFRDSFVEYRLRIHCPPALRNVMRRAVNGIVQDVFQRHGMAIPYPQLDVHLKKEEVGEN